MNNSATPNGIAIQEALNTQMKISSKSTVKYIYIYGYAISGPGHISIGMP